MEYLLIAVRKIASFFGHGGVGDIAEMEVEVKNGSFGSLVEAEEEVKEEIAEVKSVVECANDSDDVWEHIDEVLAEGKKVMAIKLYREMTGAGLKEAKQVIDDYIAERECA
jgi:ribosomal protein L7/L12